jgi:hypothetical protein
MAKFQEGDLIKATKGDTVIKGRLKRGFGGGLMIEDAGWGVESLTKEYFSLKLVERPAPTDPGVYEYGDYHETVVLHANGTWFCHGDGSLCWQMTEKDVRDFGPYTKLVPESNE